MKADKKEQIIQAAIECFVDYGYEKTTMSDIGSKVGLNKASLYYHFKDKLALFEEMITLKRAAHSLKLAAELENIEATDEMILHFLCREIDFIEKMAINFLPDNHNKNETQPGFQKMMTEIGQKLALLLTETETPEENAQLILQTCWGLLLADCPLDAPRQDRSEGYKRVRASVRKVVGLMLKGLGL